MKKLLFSASNVYDVPRRAKISARTSLLSAMLFLSSGAIALTASVVIPASTVIAQVPASSKIIYVNSATGTDSVTERSSAATPFRTITRALQSAAPGSVVQVAPGNYSSDSGETFPLVIPYGVTLKGDETNQGQTVNINGGGIYRSPIEANNNVAIFPKENSVISGLMITNPNIAGTGVWIETSNVTVRNNTLTNNRREGILVTGTASPKIESNVFTKNGGNGITMARNSRGEIRSNQFYDTGFGIALNELASPLIVGNEFSQNIDGMVISSDTAPVLRSNVIENNKRDGIVIVSRAKPDLGAPNSPGQNQIRNNARYDLHNGTKNSLVSYGNAIAKIQGIVTSEAIAASSLPLTRPIDNPQISTTDVLEPLPAPSGRVFEWTVR